MQQSSFNLRNIVIYSLVGVAVLALILVGVSWSKNRSDQYASQLQGQPGEQANNGDQNDGDQNQGSQSGQEGQTDQGDAQQGATTDEQNPAGATNGSGQTGGEQQVGGAVTTGPAEVPAAGATDWLMLALGASATAYAAMRFVQSRKTAGL